MPPSLRILIVHNRYQIRGGEDECFEAELKLLRDRGHQVDSHEVHNDTVDPSHQLQIALQTTWSMPAYRALKQKLQQQTYDLIHIHNFFPLLSPAIYYAAKSCNVPIVQTLHNYRLLCPSGTFFRAGQVCEQCLGRSIPTPAIVHGCYRDSRAATAAVATMLTVHRILGTWNQIDRFIALTDFARNKLIEGGLPADRIVLKPNFVTDSGVGKGQGNYVLFVGRLSTEKGVELLLKAWKQLDGKVTLKLVGDGPLAPQVKAATQSIKGIEWLGRQPSATVYDLMKEAMILIFPSEWYEGLPRTIIESFAVGTPVIAANLGSMSRLITHQLNGLQFHPSDVEDLVHQITWTITHPQALAAMRQAARQTFITHYTEQVNYDKLLEIYHSILPKNQAISNRDNPDL
jgi:glycosyltransferase involved in cell wall biosynthesis